MIVIWLENFPLQNACLQKCSTGNDYNMLIIIPYNMHDHSCVLYKYIYIYIYNYLLL